LSAWDVQADVRLHPYALLYPSSPSLASALAITPPLHPIASLRSGKHAPPPLWQERAASCPAAPCASCRLRSFSPGPEEHRAPAHQQGSNTTCAHQNYGAPRHDMHSTGIHLHGTWTRRRCRSFSCKYSKLSLNLFATEFWEHQI
jgi:hypothetical protein